MPTNSKESRWFFSPKHGLFLPMKITDMQRKGIDSFESIALVGEKMLAFFQQQNIQEKDGSDLSSLVANSRKLADAWKNKSIASEHHELIWDLLTIQRVAPAIVSLDGISGIKQLLIKLATGPLSMNRREPSVAKDTFWEVEVWYRAKRSDLNADLKEPDVIWQEDGMTTGVACKKVYSEKNVKDPLYRATVQIRNYSGFGFAAFNLDELIPQGQMLEVDRPDDTVKELNRINSEFLQRHNDDFVEQFENQRVSGALVSCSCLVHARSENLYYLGNQWNIWSHPKLNSEHKNRIERFKNALQQSWSNNP